MNAASSLSRLELPHDKPERGHFCPQQRRKIEGRPNFPRRSAFGCCWGQECPRSGPSPCHLTVPDVRPDGCDLHFTQCLCGTLRPDGCKPEGWGCPGKGFSLPAEGSKPPISSGCAAAIQAAPSSCPSKWNSQLAPVRPGNWRLRQHRNIAPSSLAQFCPSRFIPRSSHLVGGPPKN